MSGRVASAERLRASAAFALHRMPDGRSYVERETEPYEQYWLADHERLLLALFGGRRGSTEDEALQAMAALHAAGSSAATQRRWRKAIGEMRATGLLMGADDDASRYTAAIVQAYRRHRPFPLDLAEHMARRAGLGPRSRVLDLAGGTGDLAIALARRAAEATLMDLSRGFTRAAQARARALRLPLAVIEDSCNRLASHDGEYELVTISQALHWLDDVQVCRGVCRVLRPGGSFMVVQGAFEVAPDHPLAYLLGPDSILGPRPPYPFAAQAQALMGRLSLLFEALDTPAVQRADRSVRRDAQAQAQPRIVPKSLELFRQRRPLDAGFARAFITPQHIARTGQDSAAFWAEVDRRCAGVEPQRLLGDYEWSLLHLCRDGQPRPWALDDPQRRTPLAWQEGGAD